MVELADLDVGPSGALLDQDPLVGGTAAGIGVKYQGIEQGESDPPAQEGEQEQDGGTPGSAGHWG